MESTWASDAESMESVVVSVLLLELQAEIERKKINDKARVLVVNLD